ncbi:MAG: mersacidin/lichenicidin family type 2 lantibiotic [Candidatus Promineifilaceae bacterium]
MSNNTEHTLEDIGLTSDDVVRAWKDEEFRASLTSDQQAGLPDAPSNMAELSDEELEQIAGGRGICICTRGCTFTKKEKA